MGGRVVHAEHHKFMSFDIKNINEVISFRIHLCKKKKRKIKFLRFNSCTCVCRTTHIFFWQKLTKLFKSFFFLLTFEIYPNLGKCVSCV